jgi:hypothetical protein
MRGSEVREDEIAGVPLARGLGSGPVLQQMLEGRGEVTAAEEPRACSGAVRCGDEVRDAAPSVVQSAGEVRDRLADLPAHRLVQRARQVVEPSALRRRGLAD